jgi:hypothetical protein
MLPGRCNLRLPACDVILKGMHPLGVLRKVNVGEVSEFPLVTQLCTSATLLCRRCQISIDRFSAFGIVGSGLQLVDGLIETAF